MSVTTATPSPKDTSVVVHPEGTVQLTMVTNPPSAANYTTWYKLSSVSAEPDTIVETLSGIPGSERTIIQPGQIGRQGACIHLTSTDPVGWSPTLLTDVSAVSSVNNPPWECVFNSDSTLRNPQDTLQPPFSAVYPNVEDDPRLTYNTPCSSTELQVSSSNTIVPAIGYAIKTPDMTTAHVGIFNFTCVITPTANDELFSLKLPPPVATGESATVSAQPFNYSSYYDYVNDTVWLVDGAPVDLNSNTTTVTNVTSDIDIVLSGSACDSATFQISGTVANLDLIDISKFDADDGVGFLSDASANFGQSGEISVGDATGKQRTSINALYDSAIDLQRSLTNQNTSISSTHGDLVSNSNVFMPNSSTSQEIRFSNFYQAQCLSFYWYGVTETRGNWYGSEGGDSYAGFSDNGSFSIYVNANGLTPDIVPQDQNLTGQVEVTVAGVSITRNMTSDEDVLFQFNNVNTHLHQYKWLHRSGDPKSKRWALPRATTVEIRDISTGHAQILDIPAHTPHGDTYPGTGFAFGEFN